MPDTMIARAASETVSASVTVDRQEFRRALNSVLPVVERRNTIPVLGCVRLGIEPNRITFGATDLDIHLSTSIEADTTGIDAVAMESPHRLASLLGKMSAKTVEFAIAEDGSGRRFVSVSAGLIKAEFPTQNTDDFPAPPVVPDKAINLHFGGTQLLEAITRVAFAISTEETRYYLNGIYLHAAKSGDVPVLRAVATDSHRLSLAEVAPDLTLPKNDPLPDKWGEIIPRKTVPLLAAFAQRGAVGAAFWNTWMCAKSGASVFYSKLIDGTFPNYERVIPSGNDKSAVIPSDLIRLALARVSLGSPKGTGACKFTVHPRAVIMQSRSPEGLSITETVDLPEEPSMGRAPEFECGFNARYLAEALRHFPSAATYRWADAESPILIHAADVSASEATHLVVQMPMRV